MVVKSSGIADETLILDRNSYDLACDPIRERIIGSPAAPVPQTSWPGNARVEAENISGRWGGDLADIATCKILDGISNVKRRLTTGVISNSVLNDEDYIEVVRTKSFKAAGLQEARVTAADAGADGKIADRLAHGPVPGVAELQWRQRRRNAEQALARHSIELKIVVTTGRMRQ